MFLKEIIGFSYLSQKGLFILHCIFDDPRVDGKACETVFVKKEFVDGAISVGSIVRVYRNDKGFVSGVEVI